jgi:adenosylhomocysteine nucleosidase
VADDLVVILTALNLEYDAVKSRLADPQLYGYVEGTRFEIGTVPGTACRVVLGMTGKGNSASGILAARAMTEFEPLAVLFVGVAGAWRDGIPLGDVVLGTHVYAYQGGTSEEDGLKARPRVWEAPHWILQMASHVIRTGDWIDTSAVPLGERPPEARFGLIAAGEIVQNSRNSDEAKFLHEHYNDVMAIEMEGAGVAQAGHLAEYPVAVIRGLSDRADGTKSTEADRSWQPRAAANAAAFAVRLTRELITEREKVSMHKREAASNGGTVHNINNGGTVGVQNGNLIGSNVCVGSALAPANPSGLAAELAAFRDLLERERSSGQIDAPTYEAAQAELESATEALTQGTPEGKSKLVLALKKLHGLIGDITDLATRIAVLLTMAKGV